MYRNDSMAQMITVSSYDQGKKRRATTHGGERTTAEDRKALDQICMTHENNIYSDPMLSNSLC